MYINLQKVKQVNLVKGNKESKYMYIYILSFTFTKFTCIYFLFIFGDFFRRLLRVVLEIL